MMQPRRIFEHAKIHVVARGAEPGGFRPVDADLLAGLDAVLQETRLETGVHAFATKREPAAGPTDSVHSVNLRWSSAVKRPCSIASSRTAISRTSKSVISSTVGAAL